MSKKETKEKKVKGTVLQEDIHLDIPEDEIWTYQIEGLAAPHINKPYKYYNLKKAIFVITILIAVSLSMYFSIMALQNETFEYTELDNGYEFTHFSNTGYLYELDIDYVSDIEYIPGNNDGLNYGTSADVTAYLSQSEFCLCADKKDISGGAQYTIDISDGEKTVHSFVFLDTMDYDDEDEEHIYGYVHEDQVEWCRTAVNEKINLNKDIMLSVFIHENTPNFAKAALEGEAYKDGYSTIDEVKEEYNIPKNAPLDESFAESGRVGLVSMGHVHPKDGKCSFYNGTYYHITPQTKVSSTLITIDTKADNVRDMYNFEQVN